MAASRSRAKQAPPAGPPGPLPLPAPVLAHHGPTLAGPMNQWIAQGRIPPVLLLTGPRGIGKRDIAYHLAQWIFCERAGLNRMSSDEDGDDGDGDDHGDGAGSGAPFGDPLETSLFASLLDDGPAGPTGRAPGGDATEALVDAQTGMPRPCGECVACQRAIRGTWVDFTEVRPEGSAAEREGAAGASGAANGTLKIEQFRELKSAVGFGAHEGSHRIILIPNAEQMTIQAANSVLKLLEEPPRGWIFFLTTSDASLLLPTVLSRCQKLRLRPFTPEALVALLAQSGAETSRIRVCADLAQGSWGQAQALASDELWEKRQALFSFLSEPGRELNTWVEWAAAEPAHLELLLNLLEQVSADLVRWSALSPPPAPEEYPWAHTDAKAALVSHVRAMCSARGGIAGAREFWIARVERMGRARGELRAPLNRKLLVQDLLMPWLA